MAKIKIPFLKKNFVTPVGVAVFPRLSTPDTKFNSRGEYSVKLRLADEDVETVRSQVLAIRDAFYQQTLQETGRTQKQLPLAPHCPVKPEVDKDDNPTGHHLIISKMKASGERDGKRWTQAPAVVDAKKKPVSELVGGGSKIRVSGSLRAYYTPAVGFGVTFDLKAVQVLELSEVGGVAQAVGAFGEIDGGFESSGEQAKANFEGGSSDDSDGDGEDF